MGIFSLYALIFNYVYLKKFSTKNRDFLLLIYNNLSCLTFRKSGQNLNFWKNRFSYLQGVCINLSMKLKKAFPIETNINLSNFKLFCFYQAIFNIRKRPNTFLLNWKQGILCCNSFHVNHNSKSVNPENCVKI